MTAKQKLNSARTVIAANRTKLLAVALVVTTTGAVIQRRALKCHDDFLKENGLYDKYYETDET